MKNMYSRYLFIVLTTIFSIITAKELPIGSAIPLADEILFDAVSGETITLNGSRGSEGLLIIFSCNTCPWVMRWQDRYISITETYEARGIGVVALNPNAALRNGEESLEAMQAYAKKYGYNFPYAIDKDSKFAQAFGATRTPHIYLFDEAGVLVYRGAIDDNARDARAVKQPYLTNALDALITGEVISATETKALGCTIKFPKIPS
jgi:peroxiredoxin